MKIVICEDKKEDANQLRFLVERYFKEIDCRIEIIMYGSGDSFLEDRCDNKQDDVKIAFLDIYMPGTNGIDTARRIREKDKNMAIIFTTYSTDHGLDGFSVYALQYLVKPLNYPEVKDVLDKCTERFADSLRFIDILSDRLMVRVYLKDIIYIESFNTTLYIHTVSETVKTFLNLSALEKQLENSTFLRTQRSYLVNMRYIDSMDQNDFMLSNGKSIPISRRDKTAVKQAYRDYLSLLTWQ